ncbi:MAG: hypothetical protein Q4F30_04335 [Akkermansia sp.]|nr:hypothetical protein [Akkermansia sp.]
MKPWQNCIDCAAYDKETGSCIKTAFFIPDPSGGAIASDDCFCDKAPKYALHARRSGYEITRTSTGKRVAFVGQEGFECWEDMWLEACRVREQKEGGNSEVERLQGGFQRK